MALVHRGSQEFPVQYLHKNMPIRSSGKDWEGTHEGPSLAEGLLAIEDYWGRLQYVFRVTTCSSNKPSLATILN